MPTRQKLYPLLSVLFFIYWGCEDVDTTPPTVTITFPQNNSSVSEMVSITCISSDNEGVEKVELWVNGVTTELTDNSEPYSFDWNTTLLDNGNYTITIRSYDTSDNTTDSDPITLTVDNSGSYPQSVSITSIVFSDGSFTITWNQSTDSDFGSYELEKSVESTMGDYDVIYTTEDVTNTNYVDSDVDPLSYLYYRVSVIDTFSYKTKSQIVSSSLDPVPTSVNVTSVTYTLSEMTVGWEESVDGDFRDYELLYSETESGDKNTVVTYTDKSTTSHIITNFDPTHENWFWVLVSDTLGQSSVGSGMTNSIDSSPTQINISSVTYGLSEMVVSWNQSNDNDFVSYELLYSETQSGEQTFITTITDVNTTSYTITDFDPTQENWFKVKVTDYWNLTSTGNGMTNEIDSPPTQIDITSVTYDLTEMLISWEQSDDWDFVSYELLYSESEYGDYESLGIFTNRNTISYSISDFNPLVENWFKVKVTDFWGLTSNGSSMTNEIDNPPTQINISSIQIGENELIVKWEMSTDTDYLKYELLKSEDDGENYQIISTIQSVTDTSYIDNHTISENTRLYYKVKVTDFWGLETDGYPDFYSNYQKVLLSRNGIHIVDIDGKGLRNISNNGYSIDWNIDGSKFYFSNDGILFEVSVNDNSYEFYNTGIEIYSDFTLSFDKTKVIGQTDSNEHRIIDLETGNVIWSDNGSNEIDYLTISPDNRYVIHNLKESGSCRGDLVIKDLETGGQVNFGINICYSPSRFYFNYTGDILYWNMGGNDNDHNRDLYKTNFDGLNTQGYELISISQKGDFISGVSNVDNNLFIYTYQGNHISLYDNNGNLIDQIFTNIGNSYFSISVYGENETIIIPDFGSPYKTYFYDYYNYETSEFLDYPYFITKVQP